MIDDSSLSRAATPVLTPVLSARSVLSWRQFAVCLFSVSVYLLVAYLPLHQSVTWRHVLMGDWILSHGELPQVQPFLPLSDGFRWVPTSWLGDVLFAAIWRAGGATGLSVALAVVTLTMLLLTGRACLLRCSGRYRLALPAVAFVGLQHGTTLSVLRPELLGLTCFATLLWLLAKWPEPLEAPSRRLWIVTLGLFVLWANLDGSVLAGVTVLAALALGSLWDAVLSERSLVAALRTPHVQRAVYLAELAGLASLLQPLGIRLWSDAVLSPCSSVWTNWGGLNPLVLTSAAGLSVSAICLLAAVLLRVSPRRLSAGDSLLMLAALLATAFNSHLTIWLAAVAMWVQLPHLSEWLASRSWLAPRQDERPMFIEGVPVPPFAFKFTLLSGLAIWIGFALTPISNPVFGRRPQPLTRLVSKHAPQRLTEFLKASAAPLGLVWVSEAWGDWVTFDGPRGLRVSANSQLELLSERQRNDIVQVTRAEGNWTRTLDRYGVELLIVDKQRQPRLFDAALAQGADWTIRHEDDQALVLKRKTH